MSSQNFDDNESIEVTENVQVEVDKEKPKQVMLFGYLKYIVVFEYTIIWNFKFNFWGKMGNFGQQ